MMSTAWAGRNDDHGWAGTGVYGNGGCGHEPSGNNNVGAVSDPGWQHYPPPVPPHYTQPSVRYA